MFDQAAVRLDELEQLECGPALHAGLAALRSIPLGSAAAVRASVLWDKLIGHCQAQSMITVEEAVTGPEMALLATGHEARTLIGEELATLTHVSSGAATGRVELVGQVGEEMPLGWEALNRGELTLSHLQALGRATEHCQTPVAKAVDQVLIPVALARGWTPATLAKAAARAILELDPDGAAERAAGAKADADVRLYPGQEETATIFASGDAAAARAIMDAIEARAAELTRTDTSTDRENTPIGLRRFQALTDLVLEPSQASRLRPAPEHRGSRAAAADALPARPGRDHAVTLERDVGVAERPCVLRRGIRRSAPGCGAAPRSR